MSFDPKVVTDWITMQGLPSESPERELLWPAWEEVYDMTHHRPEDGWQFVLATLEQDSSDLILGNLSAGPLEDLLAYHGPLIIERVEAEAKRNPLFAQLLGGVWQNAMSDDVWNRVKAVWDRRGWDGIPAA